MKQHLVALFLFFISLLGFSQTNVDSPYSRFGLGESQFFGNAIGFAQGRIFTSMLDSNALNFGNPASYSFISKNRPIFNLGVSGQFSKIYSATDENAGNSVGLRHITMGFRASKRIGGSFGLAPFTAQGYQVGNTVVASNDDDPDVRYQYEGAGGLNKLFGGISYLFVNQQDHKFSIGVNTSLLFGTLSKRRTVEFSNPTYLNTMVESSARIGDYSVEIGWGYKGKVGPNSKVSLGGVFGLGNDLNATRNEFSAIYGYTGQGIQSIKDTVELINDSKGYITLPKRMAYGFSYEVLTNKENKSDINYGVLKLSAQYTQSDWSNYKEVFDGDTTNNNLKNSRTGSFGIEFQPLTKPIGEKTAYYKLVRYRAGFHTSQSFLSIDDTPISNSGISFGLGMPLLNTKSTSSINLGFELGKRGTTDNNLLEEKYFGLFIGLSLSPGSHNKWFMKRKYD